LALPLAGFAGPAVTVYNSELAARPNPTSVQLEGSEFVGEDGLDHTAKDEKLRNRKKENVSVRTVEHARIENRPKS